MVHQVLKGNKSAFFSADNDANTNS